MTSICFYFQVHQPFRLRRDYSFFDIDHSHIYEDEVENRRLLSRISQKSYLPTNKLILDLIKQYKGKFRVAYSISGTALEQFEKYCPEVIESFQKLMETGCVELLSETYYHSLSFLYSKQEFQTQIDKHRRKIQEIFGYTPTVFRNTELIYSNYIGEIAHQMGFKGVLIEGAAKILGWRSGNFLYTHPETPGIRLLPKNYRLSDDIAFRFSDKSWASYPLTANTFASWIHSSSSNGQIINLFMDYETFGEHQWQYTGIFEFMNALPARILANPSFSFLTPREAIESYESVAYLDIPEYVSWADEERDLTAWVGNDLQKASLDKVYSLEASVKSCGHDDLTDTWRKLQTSDHFYYMCKKWNSDGDVHKYFSPFNSPYDAFIVYNMVLSDFSNTLAKYDTYSFRKGQSL